MQTSTQIEGAISASRRARPTSVTVVAVVALVLGSMMLVGAALLVGAGTLQGPWGNFHEFGELAFWLPNEVMVAGFALGAIGAVHFAVGLGLVRRRAWARAGAFVLIALQVASALAHVARGEWGQVSQAGVYAVAAWALLTPRARAWFGRSSPSAL